MWVVVQRCLSPVVLLPSKQHLRWWLCVLPAVHLGPSARLHPWLCIHYLLQVLPRRGLLHILHPPLQHLCHMVPPAAGPVVLHRLHHTIRSCGCVTWLRVRCCLAMCLQQRGRGLPLVVLEGLLLLLRRREAHRGGVLLLHDGRHRERRLRGGRRRRRLPRIRGKGLGLRGL